MTTDVFFSCNFGGSIISLSSPNWVPNPSIYSLFLGGAIPLPLLTPSSPKLLFWKKGKVFNFILQIS
jgi:hypothetical protein